MKYVSELFFSGEKTEKETVGDGVRRQIMGFDDFIMLVRVEFEGGAAGYVHRHPHSQVTYVESGSFDFTIGAETRRLKAGDSTYIPPQVDHGTVCVETGVLIDVFSPIRKDFLTEEKPA